MTYFNKKNESMQQQHAAFKNFLKWKGFEYDDAYYNEEAFKNIRERFVDAAIDELGVIFFAFEFIGWTSDPKEIEILRSLYDKGQLFQENPEDNTPPSPQHFIFREAIPALMSYIRPTAIKFELAEFVYFCLDKNRPNRGDLFSHRSVAKLCWKAEHPDNEPDVEEDYEPFALRGLLAVRTLVGYEESSCIRDDLCRGEVRWSSDDFCGWPLTLNHLDSAKEVKECWDSLIAPTSFLNGNVNGLKEIAALHGWHAFRLLEEPDEFFIKKYYGGGVDSGPYSLGRLYFQYADRQTYYQGIFFTFWTGLHNQVGNRDPKTKKYEGIKPNPYANIVGLPLKSSYDTPAILYNLFDVYAKVSNIEFHSDLYYRKVLGRFITPLGNEFWFKQNYFKIVGTLADYFHYYVSGVDYYRLYALQVENVMTIMRVKPLEGSKNQKKGFVRISDFPCLSPAKIKPVF